MELHYTNMNTKNHAINIFKIPIYIWLREFNFAEEIIRDAFM